MKTFFTVFRFACYNLKCLKMLLKMQNLSKSHIFSIFAKITENLGKSAHFSVKVLISRNIGNALIKMGCLVDAMQAMESMVSSEGSSISSSTMRVDAQSLFNLIVAYYTLGDKEKMKKGFLQLLECSWTMSKMRSTSGSSSDEYGVYLLRRWMEWSHYMKQSVQLIGRAIADQFEVDGDDREYSGYDYLIHHLSAMRQRLLSEVNVDVDGHGGADGDVAGMMPKVSDLCFLVIFYEILKHFEKFEVFHFDDEAKLTK